MRLHQAFKVQALYIPTPTADPIPIYVRVHTKWQSVGPSGGEQDAPERQEITPRVLFMLDELSAQNAILVRGGVISVERGEAYSLDHPEAPDLISVKWIVTQVQNRDRLDALPIPSTMPGGTVWVDTASWNDPDLWGENG